MAVTSEFEHGSYGDLSGVAFFGPPTRGFWFERLAISNIYMHPLFYGVLERSWREGVAVPQLAAEWNAGTGWRESERCEVLPDQAAEFAEALGRLDAGDMSSECAGCTPADCLRCALAIRAFIASVVGRGDTLYIEDE